MYQSFRRLLRKNYHKTACPVLQFKHLDILIWIYSHIQDAWFVEFSVLSISYIQMHFSYFGIHTNVPSHICISYNQEVPVLPNTSFVFPCFVTPSRMFLVLSVPVLRRYLSDITDTFKMQKPSSAKAAFRLVLPGSVESKKIYVKNGVNKVF